MKNIIVKLTIAVSILVGLGCSEDLLTNDKILPEHNVEPIDPNKSQLIMVGTLPNALNGILTENVETQLLSFADFNQSLPTSAKAMIINSDAVMDIKKFAKSEIVASAQNLNIPIVVGGNLDKNKEEMLINALGGVKFKNADLVMIQTQGADLERWSVVPVGDSNHYLPMDELLIILGQSASPDITNESVRLTNEAANKKLEFFLKPIQWYGAGVYAILTQKTISDRLNVVLPTKYGWKRDMNLVMYDANFNGVDYSRLGIWLNKSYNIAAQDVKTHIIAGQGTITFRETTIKSTVQSKTIAHGFTTSISADRKAKIFNEAEFAFKSEVSFGKSWSSTVTSEKSYSVGGTIYTNDCKYACCDTWAYYVVSQNQYKRGYMGYGGPYARYYELGKSLQKGTYLVGYRFSGRITNRIYYQFYTWGSYYTQLWFEKVDPRCNSTSCQAYKECNGGTLK